MLNPWLLVQLLIFTKLSTSLPLFEEQPKCGYESCPQADLIKLNVHIVAHTHDDVGWLKTVDQYYYGSNNTIQKAGVQYIIDSVIKELWEDPERRFIYVETAFFWKWWTKQNEKTRQKVRTLVNEGRLEFIGGAWSMNDEAAVYYQSTIDQFTRGLRILNSTFGECGRPRVAWQIDPFGHSKEFASIVSQMGYDGLFEGRLDYQDKRARLGDKRMEMIWRTNADLGKSSDLFTGVLYNTYSPPAGFCFDILCADEPIIDDHESNAYNVERRVTEFLSIVRNMSNAYKTNNILVTMGEDFNYQMADLWFMNLDLLIKYTNQIAERDDLDIKLFYSTPTCYLKAVQESNPKLPVKNDDFFPYASDPHAYWTGYFTSRPTSKYFERVGNNFYQVVKQLQVLAALDDHNNYLIDELGNAMGIMQHHDAITGTEKQHVANDYARILDLAIEDAMTIPRAAISKISLRDDLNIAEFNLDRCQLNISSCHIGESVVITVYNSLAWEVNTAVRLPVDGIYNVYDKDGNLVVSDIVPLPKEVQHIQLRESSSTEEIVFIAEQIPPLGFKNYYMTRNDKVDNRVKIDNDVIRDEDLNLSNETTQKSTKDDKVVNEEDIMLADQTVEPYIEDDFIANEHIRVSIDRTTGQTTNLILNDGTNISFDIQFLYYPGALGNNEIAENRSSGAYIFRPNATSAISCDQKPGMTIFKGNVVQEIHITYSDYISAIIRLNKNDPNLEVEWLVGPIPIDDNIGKEIIVRYNTNLSNKGVFYTDSNGRQTLKRVLNERPEFNLTVYEPIASNYYPINGRIYIEDDSLRLTVLNDRPEGGSSLNEGQIELMLHRRLLHDDAFGVGEALNETINGVGLVARGKHLLHLSKIGASIYEKKKSLELLHEPNVFIADASNVSLDRYKSFKNVWTPIKNNLPDHINLLTIETWYDSTLLLRLENYLEGSDRIEEEIAVKLNYLFENVSIKSVRETMLAANLWKEDYSQMKWSSEMDNCDDLFEECSLVDAESAPRNLLQKTDGDFIVKLKPMEIVTLVVDYDIDFDFRN